MEQGLVRVTDLPRQKKVYSCPATRLAEELGKRMVLNSVMVGFFAVVTRLLDPQAVRSAVADSVPASFQELSLKAFEKGFDYGIKSLIDGPHSQQLEQVSFAEDRVRDVDVPPLEQGC